MEVIKTIFAVIFIAVGLLFWCMSTDAEFNFQTGKTSYSSGDYAEAVKYYRKAAKQGHAKAQYHLGWRYGLGEGVSKSRKEAIKWWRKSAEGGYAEAQYDLGYNYEIGKFIPADKQMAYMWYLIAAENMDEIVDETAKDITKHLVKKGIARLELNLSSAEIAAAQEEAEKMQAKIEKNK